MTYGFLNSTVNTDMKFTGSDPIYLQIVDYFKKLIEDGILSNGDSLPSVRDFAMANNINPNTVMRSYSILCQEEIIISIPKKGYFVNKEKNNNLINLKSLLSSIINKGYTKEEIIKVIKEMDEHD